MIYKDRAYAHIYFDLKDDSLSIAVYSIAMIPGFSGRLNDELKAFTGQATSYDLFTKTLRDHLEPDDLQTGRTLALSDVKDKIKYLESVSKMKDKDSRAVIDLDSDAFWTEFLKARFPKALVDKFEEMSESEKKDILKNIRSQVFWDKLNSIKSTEEAQEALVDIYNEISRAFYKKTGGKDYPGTTSYNPSSPPTFLISEEFDLAHYPGYRGAQYMTKVPESLHGVHPVGSEQKNKDKWQSTLIPDCKIFTNNKSLKDFHVVDLDNISDSLALLFYNQLKKHKYDKKLTFIDFKNALAPLVESAKTRLSKLVKSVKGSLLRKCNTEGSLVGVWLDLATGILYDSEAELLSARHQEKLPLAASNKIKNLLFKKSKIKKLLREEE